MLRHYLEVKAQHPDAIVLYRMGDFFETFYEDARVAAPIFEIQLTARQRGTPNEAPMCGVPHHAVGTYVGKLLRAGLKVAICDQVEDPKEAKGLVRREVTRVITPGTVSELQLLESREANYLLSVTWHGEEGAGAFLDVSTGTFFVRRWAAAADAVEDLGLYRPREVVAVAGQLPMALDEAIGARVACRSILEPELVESASAAADRLCRQFGVGTVRGLGLEPGELGVRAAAAALAYTSRAAHAALSHVTGIEVRIAGAQLALDETTISNLELFRSQREGRREGSLLSIVDRTATPAGARLLRRWLSEPLRNSGAIERRYDAVEELLAEPVRRDRLRERLRRVGDLERLSARAVLGTLGPPEAAALRDGLSEAPIIQRELSGASAGLLRQVAQTDPVLELRELLAATLVDDPPSAIKGGGVIAVGVDAELDRVRSLASNGKQHLLELEVRERSATGIASLKVRFNRVFGYYIEVSRANQSLVPDRYVRKQTLANAERYFTEELKELEEQILQAEERQLTLEQAAFERLRVACAEQAGRLRELAAQLAVLDVVAGFADLAGRYDYRRPSMVEAGEPLRIEEGRHPVVERATRSFVPNDLDLASGEVIVLTGPNMGGKSTYLRQIALIVLLAHVGSYVPAKAARIPLTDRIFTRVGASDNLARGESTFMVEMIETANILRHAGVESLVILDEVGRGTATFDGLSLAWAIAEELHEGNRCRTLFATHYHELTELASLLERVSNRTMAVREWQERIVFLHRVVSGCADKSYGLQVARLAGIPESVVGRAGEILANLEAQALDYRSRPALANGERRPEVVGPDQLALFPRAEELVAAVLKDLDVDRLTPIAALNLLQTLKSRLE
jgi:DNA mismatch repair protein MutS